MDAQQLPAVVLVGRPNVGKSTLFNRLTRSRDALVADRPGVTRDRLYGVARAESRRFLVVDTGGQGVDDPDIDALARRQTDAALAHAHLILFLVDGDAGLLPGDETIAERLRRSTVPVRVVVNKTEGRPGPEAVAEFHGLGLGEPLAISAVHGDRVPALIETIVDSLPPSPESPETPAEMTRIAVLGRPNAGKSTLVNRLLGEERVLTRDEPGTTRDAVSAEFEAGGKHFRIVDTAGVRRRARIRDPLEKISVIKAMQAVEAADVVLALVDARAGLGVQDVRLMGLVAEAGRGAVIAVNKWDGLASDQRDAVRDDLRRWLPQFGYMPMCTISALHGSGLRELLAAARRVHDAARADLSTPALTRVLEDAVAAHAPPAVQGRRIKLRYAHQGGRQPPRIVVHGNQTQYLPEAYRRYLERRFREAFDLEGTPIEVQFRSGENPYADR